MSIALPIAASRRGACPTLDVPMQTGDGLLARIRVAGGRIDPVRLEHLAAICGTYGNGIIEITARGNLQVRGLAPDMVPAFARAVREIVTVESGLVIETPPLAGDDPLEFVDPRPLAAAIRTLSWPIAARLGPKVAVVVDGNGQIGLEALNADVRLVAVAPDLWLLSVGTALLGTTREPLDCAGVALAALAALGPEARAGDIDMAALMAVLEDLVMPSAAVHQPTTPSIGRFALKSGPAIGLGLPFGAIGWEFLAALADGAWRFGITSFALAPQHGLVAIGADERLHDEAGQIGFIIHPGDPRLRVSACIGSDGCASGHVPARSVGARLAQALSPGMRLHVSGCAKGCAHPREADVTLVGRSDGYGLVIHGKASDTPVTLLRADQLESALAFGQG